ncbi:type 1 glutamine amidotransferase [Candidatus Kaiserbacteria bacterium]|nr:type 1 glutamine amidotransferase [Candidatus Kaiserbacteria bacterium]
MKKILVVQSRITEARIERERENYRRSIGNRAGVDFLSAVDSKLAWETPESLLENFDGIIFGGSSDFDFHGGRPLEDPMRLMSTIILSRAKALVSCAEEHRIPVLGICFGHQLIAEMHNGHVSNDGEQSKRGAFQVSLTEAGEADALFADMPKKFFAQYEHKDSATKLPHGATVLASGAACRFSALKYGENIYSLQFHPEILRVIEGSESYDSPEASRLIPLWIERIVT